MRGVDEGASDVQFQERSSRSCTKMWSQGRRGGRVVRLIPEEFALHSGRIWGATNWRQEERAMR